MRSDNTTIQNEACASEYQNLLQRLKRLNNIGVALSLEKDNQRLLEQILQAAKELTNADGGTLYTAIEGGLKFEIMLSESLGIHTGGSSGIPITFPPLPLYDDNGNENDHMVAVCAGLHGKTINIPDAYQDTQFEFSGTRRFDEQMNYRSQSFLTVPMKNHKNKLIGVLQLINALDPDTGEIRSFSQTDQELVESLTSQAAVALVNQALVREQRELFEAFITLIANTIDRKSPYTGNHCSRVPSLTMMLADATETCARGGEEVRGFSMTEDQRYELWVAGMLHDCGKITTKEYIVDKATKLETIYDRIELIDTRFELIKRDIEINALKQKLAATLDNDTIDQDMQAALCQVDKDRELIRHCNIGGEFMSDEKKQEVETINNRYSWVDPTGEQISFFSQDEVYNLQISRGTLTTEERAHINHHITATIEMLESLPYPSHMKNVPQLAGGHHERMDGKGYPKGLTRFEMPLAARMMGIADIFEALTASDRPYKKAMPLSRALTILGKMKLDNHIDPDLFDVFIHEKVYQRYADEYLPLEQQDEIDLENLPGYNPDY